MKKFGRKNFKKNNKKNINKKSFFLLTLFTVGLLSLGMVFYYRFDSNLLARLSFFIELANPSVRVVRVQEGLRKEQVAEVVGDKLGWNDTEKYDFINAHLALNTVDLEGRYFPKTYLFNKDESPIEASSIMLDEFSKQVNKIKKPAHSNVLNPDTALVIASLIQREAAGKHDMNLISGIIWNRNWSGMRLQIDATLQYAKGSEEEGWWGKVSPEDKKIESEYNTYLYKGVPPGAIANPGLDAIAAAYNPAKTKCMFYLHDRNRKIHCAVTYEQHKKNIEKYYK